MDNPRIITADFIKRIYKTPGHPVAFSSPNAVYKFFEGHAPLSMIRDALQHVDSYTLHREYKKPKYHNPYYVYHRRKQFQADLIDIAGLKKSNNGICFLLLIIDTFSRKIWVIPLKRKTAEETACALSSWVSKLKKEEGGFSQIPPISILTDNGKEFVNKKVREVMRKEQIMLQQTKNVLKSSLAERSNKSVQVLIYKYLTDRGSTKYIEMLPSLVKTYNTRKHRSLNYISPNEADESSNEIMIRSIHSIRYAKINQKRTKKSYYNQYKLGDIVRVKTDAKAPSSARRAYAKQFHTELYKVIKINRRMPIIMFELLHLDSGEKVEGGFYSNELVHVKSDN